MRLYRSESSDPYHNAERNLSGRTHYVDRDTMKCFHARVTASRVLADGLLFGITESVALDLHNKTRGKRCVVFDILGTVVYRPDLASTFNTSHKAEKHMFAFIDTFDAKKHTKAALIARKQYQATEYKRDMAELKAMK